MAGSNITFQAFKGGKPSGGFEVFADGFKGTDQLMNPTKAVARPDGVAQAPDGSLYIGDSRILPNEAGAIGDPSFVSFLPFGNSSCPDAG